MNDLLILATLLDGPQHGYALKKRAGLITGQPDLHNNVVYPLLKHFVGEGWVRRREAAGRRGQTREVYSLTAKGKQEFRRRLEAFSERDAASADAFRLRVGLFSVLDASARARILHERDHRLAKREEHLARLREITNVGDWGGEVVQFLRSQVRREREWIGKLERKMKVANRAKQPLGGAHV